MSQLVKRVAIAGFSATVLLLVSACGDSQTTERPSSSSSSDVTTPHQSQEPAPGSPGRANPGTEPGPADVNQGPNPPGEAPGSSHDDDPGGHPCTDQSGAPGTYIFSDSSNQWVCQITGDAPRPPQQSQPQSQSRPQETHDDDPGGHPCTDQSGAPGTYIFSDSSNQWVCQITGDAPRQ
jgi:hypothetical protein